MDIIRTMLAEGRRLYVDGATGTMLQALGMPDGADPARFCLDRPDIVRTMHERYVQAGADIILTPTFGGTRFKLPAGIDPFDFNKTMAERTAAAARSSHRRIFVAGDIGPVGHFLRPLGDLSPNELVGALREQARGLIAGGVDLFFIETQFDLAEARAAVAAVRLESELPVFVSMTFEDGVSLTGSTPEIFAATMDNMPVDAIGVNCGAGPEQMLPVVKKLAANCSKPIFAEPNAGLPELIDGKTVFRLGADEYAEKAALLSEYAQVLGGCCGTGPDHISSLRRLTVNKSVRKPEIITQVRLTSRSELVTLGSPFTLIGERINPTGKKTLTADLQKGSFAMALRYAEEQTSLGCRILDVNVGAPGVDEAALLPELIQTLTGRFSCALCLDSSNAAALTTALPWYPGSALVNSVSGEPGRFETIAPACRLWGAPFIILPLAGASLPKSAAERMRIVEDIAGKAAAAGIPKRMMVVDILALTAASDSNAPKACLDMVHACREQGFSTTIGLSNISFGMPARDLINSTFLAMAAGSGLASCIGNPSNARLRETADAARFLLGQDPGGSRFTARYADWKADPGTARISSMASNTASSAAEAVILGDKDNIIALVEKEVASGTAPFELVRERLIPAIQIVGEKYEKKEYFLPQLLASADAMQKAFAYLKPQIESSGEKEERKTILLATVEGDIHDIGKNIVGLLLANNGYEIVDLGKDVPATTIAERAIECGASIIGLSALMTTTMVKMPETIELVRGTGIKVMVGGAVVTREYADSIGADGYADDAVDAVRVAARLIGV